MIANQVLRSLRFFTDRRHSLPASLAKHFVPPTRIRMPLIHFWGERELPVSKEIRDGRAFSENPKDVRSHHDSAEQQTHYGRKPKISRLLLNQPREQEQHPGIDR